MSPFGAWGSVDRVTAPAPRPRHSPTMRPRFTLALLYFFAFFFGFCLLIVAPELWHVFQNVPVGPEQEEAAKRLAQEAIQPRLHFAAALAIAATGAGMYYEMLPGMRR